MLSSRSRPCLVRALSFLTLGKRGRLRHSRKCKIFRAAKRGSCLLLAMDCSALLRIGMTGRLGEAPSGEVLPLGTVIARTTIKPRRPDGSGPISNNLRAAGPSFETCALACWLRVPKRTCGKNGSVAAFADLCQPEERRAPVIRLSTVSLIRRCRLQNARCARQAGTFAAQYGAPACLLRAA